MNPDPPPGSVIGLAADASVANSSISTQEKISTVLEEFTTKEPVKKDSAVSEPKGTPKPTTSYSFNPTPPIRRNWYDLAGIERPKAKKDAVSDSSDGGTKLPAAEDKFAQEDSAVSKPEDLLKPATSQLSKLAPPVQKTWSRLIGGTETPDSRYTAVKGDSTLAPQQMKSATSKFPNLTTPINRTWAGLMPTTKVDSEMKAEDPKSSIGRVKNPDVEDKSECESRDGGDKPGNILSEDKPRPEGTPVGTPKSTSEGAPVKGKSTGTENPKTVDESTVSKPSTEGQIQPAADLPAPSPQAITAPVCPPPTTIPLTVNSSNSSAPHPPIPSTWSERVAVSQTTSNTPSSPMVFSRLSLSIPPAPKSTSPPAMTSALGTPIDPAVPLSPTHLTPHLAAAASSPLALPPGPHIKVFRIIDGVPAKIVPLTLITSKWGWIVDLKPYIKTSKSLPTPVRFLDWKKDGELRVYQPFFDDELDEASGKVPKQMEEDEDNDVPLMERGPYTVIAKATRKGGCVVVKTRGRDAVDVAEKDVEGIVKMVNRLKGW